ncbi:MAG: class I SAM-dependent methyltransferase [Verrucomicrobiales bacterium]|nr:class I SAM-dependent methyltransferase [Verrucomicrobiales bacterium]
MSEIPTPSTLEAVWARYDAVEARLTAPLSDRMLDLARLRPGMRVIDLATGRGEPAIRAAHRVAPGGSVLGIDPAATMLQMARERAEREGVRNLELRTLRAESVGDLVEGAFDAGLMRWGLMYVDDPRACLLGTRRLLKAGAPLVLAVWAEPDRVPYYTLPREVLARYAAVPSTTVGLAGTFRYADPEVLPRELSDVGYSVVSCEELLVEVMEAETERELIAWARAFGLGRLVDPLPWSVQKAWEADLSALAPSLRRAGKIRLGGVTRIVVAECQG